MKQTFVGILTLLTVASTIQAKILQHNSPTTLAQVTTEAQDDWFDLGGWFSTDDDDDDPWGIGSFFFGCILIPFSLVLLWKNEKKLVTFAKMNDEAREECTTIEADSPKDENDYKLVHCIGTTVNVQEITDQAFGATCENSYRLVREVEMYQIHETVTERKDGNSEIKEYNYEYGWYPHPINSANFNDKSKKNPSNTWPF